MTDEPLPPELAELENRLGRRLTTAGPALRKRVLDAVADELAGREDSAPARPGWSSREATADCGPPPARPVLSFWSYFAVAASILIVALNLAGMAAGMTDYIDGHPRNVRRTTAMARSIRQAIPELSQAQAQSMAVTMSSGQHLLALPVLRGSTPANRTIIQEP